VNFARAEEEFLKIGPIGRFQQYRAMLKYVILKGHEKSWRRMYMIFNFIKTSPAQNTTVLITSFCPQSYYLKIAEIAMKYEFLHAEQVGFIVPPSKKESILGLEMAGGEFCGNATLSAAAYAVFKGLVGGKVFNIDVSGAAGPIRCKVQKLDDYRYNASCVMPPAKLNQELKLDLGNKTIIGQVIELDGISHFVFPEQEDFAEYLDVVTALKQFIDANAIGVIPFKTIKDDTYSIKPFVHVKKVNTNVFERGCGSGSLALGMYLNKVFGMSKRIEVVQPGGVIGVEMGSEYSISTDVVFTCEGTIMV
jgi:diaminopimelate epimerase